MPSPFDKKVPKEELDKAIQEESKPEVTLEEQIAKDLAASDKESRQAQVDALRKAKKESDIKVDSKIDWTKVTEADLMKLPIEARSFDEAPILSIRPKNSDIEFRWVNFKNMEGANVARFKSKGFQFTNVDDVAGGLDGITEGSVGVDGNIKYYDIVCMKINKLRLYEHYKAALLKSNKMINPLSANREARANAEAYLSTKNGQALSAAKQAGHRIDFYNPTGSELGAGYEGVGE